MIESMVGAFIVGLLGSGHCVAMCGGLSAAVTAGFPPQLGPAERWGRLVCYNGGRILSYSLAGAAFGALGSMALYQDALAMKILLRGIAGCMLIAMGLYVSDLWRGLVLLERGGQAFWRWAQQLTKGVGPAGGWCAALLGGLAWGVLPCGLVYSALALALAQGSIVGGAQVMLAFGVGTLPTVLLLGGLGLQLGRWLRRRDVRLGLGALLVATGLWTWWGAFPHSHNESVLSDYTGNEPFHSDTH